MDLPFELLLHIFQFVVEGDNEEVLLRNTSKKWCEIIAGRRKTKKSLFYLDCSIFIRSLSLIKWASENTHYYFTPRCTRLAASQGNIPVLQWLIQQGCELDDSIYVAAAYNGQLEVLKWLDQQGYKIFKEDLCAFAARGGHFEVLKWLRSKDCPWSTQTCAKAASGGHLKILKWLRKHGCPWDVSATYFAAKNGHLEILNWLSQEDCPWNSDIFMAASYGGHLEVLKWLVSEYGRIWIKEYCIRVANQEGHPEVVEWLQSQLTVFNS